MVENDVPRADPPQVKRGITETAIAPPRLSSQSMATAADYAKATTSTVDVLSGLASVGFALKKEPSLVVIAGPSMGALDDPFSAAVREIDAFAGRTRVILVDFHAEATSEKIAMGWHLDGRVTAVIGTHTHVQTADERILPNGTAYITDAGMTGPHDSIIGTERAPALARFLTGMPSRFEPAVGNPRLHGVVIAVDDATGKATAITRLDCTPEDLERMDAETALK